MLTMVIHSVDVSVAVDQLLYHSLHSKSCSQDQRSRAVVHASVQFCRAVSDQNLRKNDKIQDFFETGQKIKSQGVDMLRLSSTAPEPEQLSPLELMAAMLPSVCPLQGNCDYTSSSPLVLMSNGCNVKHFASSKKALICHHQLTFKCCQQTAQLYLITF